MDLWIRHSFKLIDLVRVNDDKGPRGVLNSNRGFVELGSFAINRLRRGPVIALTAWNRPKVVAEVPKPKTDPLRIARYYQSLLDSGKFESRAALASYLGVSRARVTQVLNRLATNSSKEAATG